MKKRVLLTITIAILAIGFAPSQDPTSPTITVSWKANTEPDMLLYHVWAWGGTDTTKAYYSYCDSVMHVPSATSYEMEFTGSIKCQDAEFPVSYGMWYRFAVAAKDVSGNLSEKSHSDFFYCREPDTVPPATPSKPIIRCGGKKI